MAKKKGPTLDWVTIKYKDIYMIVGIPLLVIILGGSLYGYWRWQGNPRARADRAISKAQDALDNADSPDANPEMKANVIQGRTMLGLAKSEYALGHYPKAISLANDVLEGLKNLGAGGQAPKYAVLVGAEGSVEVKRIGQHLFTSAKEQMILEDGDIVRTGQNSYARIKYHNQTFQIINPDSLVVIQALSTNPEGGNRVEVALKQGGVETQTPETMGAKDESIIATETTRVKPSAASRVAVAQAAGGNVTTSVLSGGTQIEAGGKKESYQAGDAGLTVLTTAAGIISSEALVAPPAPVFPRDQQIIRVEDPVRHEMAFEWSGGGTTGARFQLSAKPLFSSLLAPDQIIRNGKISVDGLPGGTYYWRLRAEGDEKKTYWSPIYRFRLLQILQRPRITRTLKLVVDATPIGDGLILQGSTDPGVSVSVNDLEVPVNTDGTFSKIILFSDVGSHSVHVRAFDDEGNETSWRKTFKASAY